MTRARDLANFVSNAQGDVRFDTDTLFIDSSANRVGIGTTSPSAELSVNGRVTLGDQSGSGTAGAGGMIVGASSLFIQASENKDSSTRVPIIFSNIGGSTESMRINGSGNVGVGTSSPDTLLHLSSASGSTGSVLRLESTDTSVSSGQQVGAIEFESNDASTGGSGVAGKINTVDTNAFGTSYGLTFSTGNASGGSLVLGERARIDFDGLKFNGDTAAANALDDYEEGSWTPTSPDVTLSVGSACRYIKIGKFFLFTFDINFPTSSSNTASNIQLPFSLATYNHSYAGWNNDNTIAFGHVAGYNMYFYEHGSNFSSLTYNELSGKRLIGSLPALQV